MITLCPATFELAKTMPNFSAWVRHQLLLLQIQLNDPDNDVGEEEEEEQCNNCEEAGAHFCRPLGMWVK
jgi:hypothetical protein